MHDYLPPPIAPISDIWLKARAMFVRLSTVRLAHWLYALEALVRKLVLLEAMALAPIYAAPAFRLPLHLQQVQPEPAPREPAQRGHSFRLWPKAKPHPARLRLLGKAASAAEHNKETLRLQQLERLKQARAKRATAAQLMLRRLKALGGVLEKPLPYARRLARKLRASSKTFLAKLALKRPPRSPYIDAQVQADAEKHCWAVTRAAWDARTDSS